MLKSGIQMHQEISVPMKGNYWLRIGLDDRTGDRIGAVEVNLDNVNKEAAQAAPAKTVPITAPTQ